MFPATIIRQETWVLQWNFIKKMQEFINQKEQSFHYLFQTLTAPFSFYIILDKFILTGFNILIDVLYSYFEMIFTRKKRIIAP